MPLKACRLKFILSLIFPAEVVSSENCQSRENQNSKTNLSCIAAHCISNKGSQCL